MHHIKTCYIHRNFCYGMLIFVIVICPFFSVADQQDTQSEVQEKSHVQNQNPAPLTRQDLRDVLSEQQEPFVTQSTVFVAILGFLLLVILIFLVWMFFQYKAFVRELGEVNSGLERSFSDIRKRIQDLEKTFDSEVLYQKLAAGNETNTQEVLNRLEHLINIRQNDVSSNTQEATELSQQHESGTGEGILPPAIVEFCNHYNAGIQDMKKQGNFVLHYEEHYKIYVENTMDRRVNQQIDPLFKTDSAAGSFLACYIEEEKLYAVVPVYRLRIEHTILHHGAFVDVFKCPDLDPNRCYEVVKIIQPAVFEPDDRKETWILKERGIVELQENK